jgi:hypothetical protein
MQTNRLRLLRSLALAAAMPGISGCSLSSSGVDPAAAQSRETPAHSGYLYVGKTTYSPTNSEILVYAPNSSRPVQTIRAGINGGFTGPQGFAFDKAGNLYVGTNNRGAVVVYGPGKTSPSYTITEGIDDPVAMDFDSADNLYVLNCPNCGYQSSVAVFAPGKTSPSYTITAGVRHPIALAIDRSDNLYVANCSSPAARYTCTGQSYPEPGGGDVTVYRRGKKAPAYTIRNGIDAPRSVAVDASGNLYVANVGDAEIAVYHPHAKVPSYSILLGIFDGVQPTSMAFDPKGNLYVAKCAFGETGRVCVYPPGSPSPIAYYQSPPGYVPNILGFDPSGNLYVLEVSLLPSHAQKVEIAAYPPMVATPKKIISTGNNYATSMAVSP